MTNRNRRPAPSPTTTPGQFCRHGLFLGHDLDHTPTADELNDWNLAHPTPADCDCDD